MKRLSLILLLVCSLTFNSKGESELYFFYFAHSVNTPVPILSERLKKIYKNALNDKTSVIFYLPRGAKVKPVIVRVNTGNDNRDDFDKLIDEFQSKRAHDVDPSTDLAAIQQIFNEEDFIDENGNLRYSFIEWNYYVTATFWELGYHESVIASLFWIFDMDKYIKEGNMKLNIFYSGEYDPIEFDEDNPFGSKDLCRVVPFLPMPY